MKSKEVALTAKENGFIEALLDSGGDLQEAAAKSGYSATYVYQLRDRLSKHIIEATKKYIAMNSLRAAVKMVNSIDSDAPLSPLQQAAAKDIMDRAGIKHQEEVVVAAVKANIFILPDKQPIQAIETEYAEVNSTLQVPEM